MSLFGCWLAIACGSSASPPAEKNLSKTGEATVDSIGTATMNDDGTIVLQLRAQGPAAAVGDGRVVYPKGHERYAEILEHLGGLKPGEEKPVPPWDE